MDGDDYRHVSEWAENVLSAEALGLSLIPNTETRSIIIEELGFDGPMIANVKLEKLSTWLEGFEAARGLMKDES